MGNRVYQFKITMKIILPYIWRRILIPETYNFWDLHVAIQDAFGWLDSHPHVFRIRRKNSPATVEIGIPNKDRLEDEPEILPGWEISILTHFIDLGTTAEYEYDFGDTWLHEIVFEGIILKEKDQEYPKCIDGARACPPEDCGGVSGYYNLLNVISNPDNEEYKKMIAWLGKKYDPDEFEPAKVKFDDPRKRWNQAFS